MKRLDMTAKRNRAMRAGGAIVADVALQVAMLRNPGALIRNRYVSD